MSAADTGLLQHQDEEHLNETDFVGADIEKSSGGASKLADIFGKVDLTRETHQPRKVVGYIEGLKGLIAFEAFLWVFLRTVVPGAIFESLKENPTSPRYESVLREVFSPLFWDGSLQAAFFIIISTRVVSIRFLESKSSESMAGTLFRRGLRLWFPTAVALMIATVINHNGGFVMIRRNAAELHNNLPVIPYKLPTVLAYFNAVFNLFWHTTGTQAGVRAFPTGMLWIVPIVYQESFTVYMLMLMFPYVQKGFRFWGMVSFLVVAWWVDSWSWYGITGLIFADVVINMDFMQYAKKGLALPRTQKRLSFYWVATFFLSIGIILKYVYEDAAPNHINDELIVHTPIYGGGLNRNYDINQPQQRVSSWFVVVGALMFIEMNVMVQRVFANPLFRYLGRISFSWFLIQSCIIYTVGLQLNLRLQVVDHWSRPLAQFVSFLTCLVLTIPCADVFTRLVDNPSKWLADWLFDWIRR